jgi:hypothetical protein
MRRRRLKDEKIEREKIDWKNNGRKKMKREKTEMG